LNLGFSPTGDALPGAMTNFGTSLPGASELTSLTSSGFYGGAVGKFIRHNGQTFASVGGLINALASESKVNIIMNPKIVTEDNAEAQIFIGLNRRFQTNSLVNKSSEIITTNYEYRNVGSSLTVRPLIGNNDLITLEISQEISSVDQSTQSVSAIQQDLGPSTYRSLTQTKVHLPNKFFLMMSGMIQDESSKMRYQVPCLGSLPLVSSILGQSVHRDSRRNLMIFIRPQILDTSIDMEEITQKAQAEYREKTKTDFDDFQKERMREILKFKAKSKAKPVAKKS
jgi:type III secretion protein C